MHAQHQFIHVIALGRPIPGNDVIVSEEVLQPKGGEPMQNTLEITGGYRL